MTTTVQGHCDVVLVGGGVGGSGLAAVLAREGITCLVLEATDEFPDRTKGEWIAGWGILDARRCGLEDELRQARGHSLPRAIRYDEGRTHEDSEKEELRLDTLMPGLPAPLTQRHPDLCQVLFDAASNAGATTLRSVRDVSVKPGGSPQVSFTHGEQQHNVVCRLVVGADGRNSAVRRQLGLTLQHDEPHHLFSGLLVDDAEAWPEDLQITGTENDVHYLAFPQGKGRVRLYLGWALEDKHRFSGAPGPERFVETFAKLTSVRDAGVFAKSTSVSPCATYANEDTWLDQPFVPGVVLIGDAAGWNDPITGQGLSITFRDIRVISELLLASNDWSVGALQTYATERSERMRRLRFTARLTAVLSNEFGGAARARRERAHERFIATPELGISRAIIFIGPELAPADAFTQERWNILVA